MKGLIVKQPWKELILEGKKVWEIRGRNTKIRGKIALIKSGSGMIFGTVELRDSKEITFNEYRKSERFHCIPENITLNQPYPRIYAWELENPILFEKPIPYKHPQGAVIWVNLKDIN